MQSPLSPVSPLYGHVCKYQGGHEGRYRVWNPPVTGDSGDTPRHDLGKPLSSLVLGSKTGAQKGAIRCRR
jgi:hypothetical protein